MNPGPIEFYTTRELVDELVRRTTFLGVVVHAEQELKGSWKGERTFQVLFNSNLDPNQACRLLDAVVAHLEKDEG